MLSARIEINADCKKGKIQLRLVDRMLTLLIIISSEGHFRSIQTIKKKENNKRRQETKTRNEDKEERMTINKDKSNERQEIE